jgi:endonuclease/exonuclease/phosphatase (EEP) superfamily protein YafD
VTSSDPGRAGTRRLVDLAVALALVGLVGVGALRWLDTTNYPIVVLQTAGPFVVIGLVVLAVATALLRRWWMLHPVAVSLAVAGTVALPPYFARTTPDAPRDLTVMTVNLSFGKADPDQVMGAVRARSVDVLVLTEVTPDAAVELAESGIDDWLTERVGEARPGDFTGTMVYSRYPITEVTGDDPVDEHTPSLQPEVVVDVSGTAVRLKATHVLAPVGGDTQDWRLALRALASWRDRQDPDQPILLVGDFNASQGHPAFRSVEAGLEDAHRAAGLGWVRTWPIVGRAFPPYVQLDHLLSRGLSVVEAGQTAIHGTDHAILWATYSFSQDAKPVRPAPTAPGAPGAPGATAAPGTPTTSSPLTRGG